MAYTRTTWATGDTISATKLNNLETGVTGILDGTHTFTGNQTFAGTVTAQGANHSFGSAASVSTRRILYLLGNISDASEGYGLDVRPTQTATTSDLFGASFRPATSAAAITATNVYSAYLGNPTKGAGSTIGTAYGLYVENVSAGTTNYSVYVAGGQSFFGGGIVAGAATGGDKGAGTINVATDVYKNNSAYANPDYVLEHWATSQIVKYADKEGAATYTGLAPLSQVKQYVRDHWHLPRFGQAAGHGLFSGGDALLASLEEAYLYIFQLEARINALEAA